MSRNDTGTTNHDRDEARRLVTARYQQMLVQEAIGAEWFAETLARTGGNYQEQCDAALRRAQAIAEIINADQDRRGEH